MGRKPNAIVSEFFHRGAKLHDSSNRYEHTCKLCGQNFPKGRADSLLGHLVKTCQAISTPDKQRVLHLWRAVPERGSVGAGAQGAGGNKKGLASGRIGRGKSANLPYAARQTVFNGIGGLNGLNVLAEASRQVGASDEHPGGEGGVGVGDGQGENKSVVVDPALETPSKRQDIEADLRAALGSPPPTTQYDPNSAESATSMAFLNNNNFSLAPDPTPDAGQSSQLSLIAEAANEMVPQDLGLSLEHEAGSDFDASTHHAALYPRPIAIHPSPQDSSSFINNFGETNQPAKHHKVRAQFSEERRKEVQAVRKMGACLRCRMLKKTCSSGDPCRQCQAIQNPRVWMECCIRDRLPTQLTVYSSGLHTTLAYHDINNIKAQIPFDLSIGRIEICHFDCQPPKFMTFSALHGQKEIAPNVDPQLPISTSDGEVNPQVQDIRILEGDVDELSVKLETYIKTMAPQYIESEPSNFVKQTVSLAWELYQNTADKLLAGVLDLWIATRIIVDSDLRWKIYLNPTLPPSSTQPLSSTSTESSVSVDETTSPETYSLICSQMRAAAERFASRISKTVLSKVEQRLLQKQRSGHFQTFLGAVILINCVERITWLFQMWDSEQYSPRWPLENRPLSFASQGDRFSGIVATHLRMRSLAPDCVVDPETNILKSCYSRDPDVTRWFEAIRISPNDLEERQAAKFDISNPRSLDMVYCMRLFRQGESSNVNA
ncbi:hypothetical protein FQN52_004030 [Onygenales sp. PD_12]|nr:hypothetical protein FQN52_004030 [Onygenales sp. PD_12]